MKPIGQRIYEIRTKLNMSQEELAKKVGYKDRSSIARIESGDRDIRQNKVIEFAKALQTTPASLMGYEDEEKENAPGTDAQSDFIEPIAIKADAESWNGIFNRLSREGKVKLFEHAKLLLLAQDQVEKEDQ